MDTNFFDTSDKPKMKCLQVMVPPEVYRQLKKRAESKYITLAQLLRCILKEYLTSPEKPRPSKAV